MLQNKINKKHTKRSLQIQMYFAKLQLYFSS